MTGRTVRADMSEIWAVGISPRPPPRLGPSKPRRDPINNAVQAISPAVYICLRHHAGLPPAEVTQKPGYSTNPTVMSVFKGSGRKIPSGFSLFRLSGSDAGIHGGRRALSG